MNSTEREQHRMARAFDPDELDSDAQRIRRFDEAWLDDLELIRELTRQERQAEDDRLFAARIAGIEIEMPPDEIRQMAMLLNDRDDEDDDRLRQTSMANTVSTASFLLGEREDRVKTYD